ncbi:bifunctional 4-hydroxy-2-oxoglutarate aldolase/2-dehydro-3-deoxy-phosphogluconate aldolase [Geosporobacter ferrireducens]|uniref:Response regulatory domain-containing protein n=1 Tax=Geosporobacter ferrireducens TaxID=1424294 RepID=A0A1D8GFG4_9FIRM|nr:bifunctional 4-hydroxy-2-oxoglutarate aldolase/2-dehydro-3-deoxy-phosphogluconate aldolase [Geosporobacter ferrireducens]AOT69645.1 hypothetical protein Gferi_08680 [Geosporobacter ferrireducens]MTI54650.1 bifunctional 4-hydroxy-2-oxoglutarate aldolase/2-dehydro-3-deoxy-phosphogluconate aldolase [Geosporobacter ferrireducens]
MKELFELIKDLGMVPTLAIEDAKDAANIAKALNNASLPLMEVMLRTESGFEAIHRIAKEMPKFTIGAGTVLSCEQAKKAIDAGASFIVSPNFNEEVVRFCTGKNVTIIPGCTTPTEIDAARKMGIQIVKYFPAVPLGGVESMKLLAGAFPEVRFIATGGITREHLKTYTKNAKIIAVGGGFMVDKSAIKNRDFVALEQYIKETVADQLNFTIQHVGINAKDLTEAAETTNALCDLLGLPSREASKSLFAGNLFEVMKFKFYGENGHVALGTDDVPRAYAFFQRKGMSFIEDTKAYDEDGRLEVVYLKETFGGFAIHLLKNPKK